MPVLVGLSSGLSNVTSVEALHTGYSRHHMYVSLMWGKYKRWTFSDSVDKRARFETLPSVVSAGCIAPN